MIFETDILTLDQSIGSYVNNKTYYNQYQTIYNRACCFGLDKFYNLNKKNKIIILFSTDKVEGAHLTKVSNLRQAGKIALIRSGYKSRGLLFTKIQEKCFGPSIAEVHKHTSSNIAMESIEDAIGYDIILYNKKTKEGLSLDKTLWWWVEIVE